MTEPSLRVRIIGRGRAGASFAGALRSVGVDVDGPLGRGDDMEAAARGVDLVLICVTDAAVAAVAGAIDPVPGTLIAHVAGSLGLDVLAPHPRRASLHPVVSLPDVVTGAAGLLDAATFAIAGDSAISQVVTLLGGRAVAVAEADRVLHHAAACIASNHLVALMGQVERIAESIGVPADAYLGLAQASMANVVALGAAAALTGPAARGDIATIERHVAALDPSERAAYRAMADSARRLARERDGGAS